MRNGRGTVSAPLSSGVRVKNWKTNPVLSGRGRGGGQAEQRPHDALEQPGLGGCRSGDFEGAPSQLRLLRLVGAVGTRSIADAERIVSRKAGHNLQAARLDDQACDAVEACR